MELLSLRWQDDLSNAFTNEFRTTKALAEKKLNEYYFTNQQLIDAGYMRTLVLKFEAGKYFGTA